ncbi:hypothetical protein [Oceanimonas smirnovii]|uniref:hypothetical protein n=1 Tax=Oceanimonas smirnovii TaxID=264574 RepID=UPI003FD02591
MHEIEQIKEWRKCAVTSSLANFAAVIMMLLVLIMSAIKLNRVIDELQQVSQRLDSIERSN